MTTGPGLARRMAGRVFWGLLFAVTALGALHLVAARLAPPNHGMSDAPCPPRAAGGTNPWREFLMTLGGQPEEMSDWAGTCAYARANAALVATGIRPDIVFLGDSITENWAIFEPALFSPRIINRGLAGQTSGQVLIRLMPDGVALRPRAIHLLVGYNDVVGRRGSNRPVDFRNNLTALLDLARAHRIAVIVGAIPPVLKPGGPDPAAAAGRIAALNAWLRGQAAGRGLAFADYWTAMAAPDGSLRAEFTDDGVHPNAAGYAAMSAVVRPIMARVGRDGPA